MDIRVLQYFLAVAREESITKAAEVLNMTQPPLSRQMKELEEELGKQLLIRGKKITLTEDGMLLRKRAEELVELMEKTKAEMTAPEGNIAGDIHIGCGETHAISFLAKTAQDLRETYPLIRFHLYSGDGLLVREKLEKGLIDFGLMVGWDVSEYDSIRLPVKDTWGVLMPADDPLSAKEAIRPEDLWDKPLLFSRQQKPGSALSVWMRREYEKLHIVGTYNLIYNAAQFARLGIGYALTLDKLIHAVPETGLCFRPLFPKLEADLSIVWKRYQVQSRAAAAFLEQLQKEIAEYQPEQP